VLLSASGEYNKIINIDINEEKVVYYILYLSLNMLDTINIAYNSDIEIFLSIVTINSELILILLCD
jgi:hypothetical protein